MPLRINTCPPGGPTKDYMDRMVRTIELWATLVENPGILFGAGLNMTNLQEDGWGLRIGDVFVDTSTTPAHLAIVRAGEWYFRGVAASSAAGTVTVVTP